MPILVAIAKQLRSVATLVERGELGNVEDLALVLTRYGEPAWGMGVNGELGDIVARGLGTAKAGSGQ